MNLIPESHSARAALGAILSPVLLALGVFVVNLPFVAWYEAKLLAEMIAVIGWILMILFGVPVHFALRSRGYVTWQIYSSAGALIAVFCIAIVAILESVFTAPGYNAFSNFSATKAALKVVELGGCAALGGFVFWAIVVRVY